MTLPQKPRVGIAHVRLMTIRGGLPAERDDRFVDVAFETTDLAAMKRYLVAKSREVREVEDAGEGQGESVETTDDDGHRIRVIQLNAGPMILSGSDRRLSKRVLHLGLTIREAAKADGFYRDVLGFSEIWRGGWTFHSVEAHSPRNDGPGIIPRLV